MLADMGPDVLYRGYFINTWTWGNGKMGNATVALDPHVMSIMDPDEGDVKVKWDPGDDDQVEVARTTFNKLKKKGMLIYRLGKTGRKGEVLREFDPEAKRIIATPRQIGG